MNVICIDPSLICTAVVINDKKFVYAAEHIVYTENGKMKSWFHAFEKLCTLRTFDVSLKCEKYTECENQKIILYKKIINDILLDIEKNVNDFSNCIVAMEGYSFSSVSGPLIDLVTFGTILRYNLLERFNNIHIIAPQQLKHYAASLVYPEVKKGKIIKYINNDGISAGSFKKHQMMQCLLDYADLNKDEWIENLNLYKNEIMKLKSIPKPIEDINDAKLMYHWVINNL